MKGTIALVVEMLGDRTKLELGRVAMELVVLVSEVETSMVVVGEVGLEDSTVLEVLVLSLVEDSVTELDDGEVGVGVEVLMVEEAIGRAMTLRVREAPHSASDRPSSQHPASVQ